MTNKSAFYATFPAPTRASTFFMNACLKFQFGSCQNIATVSLMTDKKKFQYKCTRPCSAFMNQTFVVKGGSIESKNNCVEFKVHRPCEN